MITLRNADDRGQADFGWLDSRHSFSFGQYMDPAHMGFGPLRVINDDRVAPGMGFDTHGHRDMEIISYVIKGALIHKDSEGNEAIIRPGEVQRMSAGTGVLHSEYNHSATNDVRFLQIWIIPDKRGTMPGYDQIDFGDERRNTLRLVASGDGRDGSIFLHQDADLYASLLEAGNSLSVTPAADRLLWLQVAEGSITLNGITMTEGDGAAIKQETALDIAAISDSNILLFDMAA